MSEAPQGPVAGDEEQYYTETVVEYVDNSRQRAILSILVVVLFLVLVGAIYSVARLTAGKGAPQVKGTLPRGITWVRSIYGWGNAQSQRLNAPTDVAVGPNGTIWVVSGHRTIAGFNPDGTAKKVFEPKNTASLEGITVGDNGNLYVTDFGGQVIEFTPDGTQVDQWKVELANEIDVRDGRIAVAAGEGVAVFTDDDSKVLFKLGSTRGWGKEQFDLPHGIVSGPDGTLFVSDTQNRRVKAYSSTGRLLWILGEAPDRSKPGAADVRSNATTMSTNPFLLPSGITMDGNGRLVVVDPFRFRIAVIDPETRKIAHEESAGGKPGRQAFYGEQGAVDGFFNYPTGIAYDKSRDWFAVADTFNNRVQIVRIPGSGGSPLALAVGSFRPPMCVLCIPWLLLLVAVLVLASRRRGQRRDAEPSRADDSLAGVGEEA